MMKNIFLFLIIIGCSFSVQAQKNYAVKVADAKTEDPLDGAKVVIRSTKKKVMTNETGLLVIQAVPGDVLAISRRGYVPQEATLSASSAVQVFLEKKPAKKKKR